MALEFVSLVDVNGENVVINRENVLAWVTVSASVQRIFMNDEGTCVVASTNATLLSALQFNVATLVGQFTAFTQRGTSAPCNIARKFVSTLRAFDANNTRVKLSDGSEIVVVGSLSATTTALNFTLL